MGWWNQQTVMATQRGVRSDNWVRLRQKPNDSEAAPALSAGTLDPYIYFDLFPPDSRRQMLIKYERDSVENTMTFLAATTTAQDLSTTVLN